MAKICPETNDYVLYLDCQECDTKSCMQNNCTVKSSQDEDEEIKKE